MRQVLTLITAAAVLAAVAVPATATATTAPAPPAGLHSVLTDNAHRHVGGTLRSYRGKPSVQHVAQRDASRYGVATFIPGGSDASAATFAYATSWRLNLVIDLTVTR